MSHREIVRAWKDEEYRSNLNSRHRAMLPDNPAGATDISDEELAGVGGGTTTGTTTTLTTVVSLLVICSAITCYAVCSVQG